ncbi:MAG: MmcQ/YjbR family DNA-binding protein [Mangrovibacterium sp.]
MHIDEIRDYCLAQKGAKESMPFDDTTLVFKVGGKMFALLGLNKMILNLKCDPERALNLREKYTAITEGYHMNKRLWNSLSFNDGLPQDLIIELINHSYRLIVNSLPKKIRNELEGM